MHSCQFFRIKSNPHIIHVLLLLRFSIYLCHGNDDFLQKPYYTKLQSKTSTWCKFHIHLRRRRLLNGQMKRLGMVWKNCSILCIIYFKSWFCAKFRNLPLKSVKCENKHLKQLRNISITQQPDNKLKEKRNGFSIKDERVSLIIQCVLFVRK